ncbi:MAG: hypothetical protein ACRCZS_12770 [Chroococcidiopsis sp.]
MSITRDITNNSMVKPARTGIVGADLPNMPADKRVIFDSTHLYKSREITNYQLPITNY